MKANAIWGGAVLLTGAGLLTWCAVTVVGRLIVVADSPDLTGDGVFTISDLPNAFGFLVLAPGGSLQRLLGATAFGQFIEMSATAPRVGWSFALSLLAYTVGWGMVVAGKDMISDARSDG